MPPGGAPLRLTPRQSRAAARKSASDTAKALAAHFTPQSTLGELTTPAPVKGATLPRAPKKPNLGGYKSSKPIPLLNPPAPVKQTYGTGPTTRVERVNNARVGRQEKEQLQAKLTHSGGILGGIDKTVSHAVHVAGSAASDFLHEQALKASMVTSATIHHPLRYLGGGGDYAGAIENTHVKNGQVVLPKDPGERTAAEGLISLSGSGNIADKAMSDIYGIPVGLAAMAVDPEQNVPAVIHGTEQYYSRNPISNFHQDPFAFGLNYVLPIVSGGAGVAERAGALADVARATAPDAELSLGDIARLREKGALEEALKTGQVPRASAAAKAKLTARALLKPPSAGPRTYTVHSPEGDEFTVSAPSSNNAAVNAFHRVVTNRVVNNALEGGRDVLGGNSTIGRLVRTNLRFKKAIANSDVARLAKLKLSPAQEHAAWMTMKGVDPELYAAYHQAGIDSAIDDRVRANHETGLHLTKLAGQHLKPGEENAKVMEAVSIMRGMMERREGIYGMSEHDVQHAIGSHYTGIVRRAKGQSNLHSELEAIEEKHGVPAANPRHELDNEIASVERRIQQSGPEHAAVLQEHLNEIRQLSHDVEFKRYQIANLDRRLSDLGPEVDVAGRYVQHPEGVAASSRELLAERARLADEEQQLLAHERHRQINAEFVAKGGEVLGHVRPSAARDDVLANAAPDEKQMLDNAALNWSRRNGESTAEFYRRVKDGTLNPRADENAAPENPAPVFHAVRESLDEQGLRGLEQHYGVKGGSWSREQAARFGADMQRAARGEDVPQAIQTAYNSALVAPPEGGYLPFAEPTKQTKPLGGTIFRRQGQFGHSPAAREAVHRFTGRTLEHGDFSTEATRLARWKFTKATHWQAMDDLFTALWSLSKETPEEARYSRWNPSGQGERGAPVPIRDVRQVTDEQRRALYASKPGEFLEGEAPDELAQQIMDHLTRPAEPDEHVRYVNADIVRPLTPKTAGGAARFFNGINQVIRFTRFGPSYARWVPQNLVINLVQQGPLIFRNAAQMMTQLHGLDPELYYQIASGTDHGTAMSLAGDLRPGVTRTVQNKVAGFWAHVADHIPRMLSFIHEADSLGFRTPEAWDALMNDPRLEAERQTVLAKANRASMDFGGLTPFEKANVKTLFATWPWVRAASLWAARFPFEHPYQSTLAMQASPLGQKVVSDFWQKHGGIAPPYDLGSFPTATGLWDTEAVDPWSQAAQDLQTYSGFFPGHPENAGAGFGMLAPVVRAGTELVTGRDQYGNAPKGGPAQGALQTLEKGIPLMSDVKEVGKGGGLAGLEKFLGSPLASENKAAFTKTATNALKDVDNESRERFKLKEAWQTLSSQEQQSLLPQAKLAIRVAQVKDAVSGKLPRARALALTQAAAENQSLDSLNSLLQANGLKPYSQGDLLAEKARIRSISFP